MREEEEEEENVGEKIRSDRDTRRCTIGKASFTIGEKLQQPKKDKLTDETPRVLDGLSVTADPRLHR